MLQRSISHISFCLALLWHFSAAAQHQTLRRGDKMYDEGKYDKAREAYQKAGNAQGMYNAGNAAIQQNNPEAAEAFYQKAVDKSLVPQQKADALFNLGNALLQQRKYKEAIAAYEKSLRLQPNQQDAQKNLQIAKRRPPQPPPPPPPPPPTPPPPRRVYLDQANPGYQPGTVPYPLSPESARQILSKAVTAEEQRQAQSYRQHTASGKPSRVKKDW